MTIPASTASRSKGIFYAGGAGLFIIGMTFIGGFGRKRRIVLLLVIVVLFASGSLCRHPHPTPAEEMSYTASGLSSGTTYYWKVAADDGNICNRTQSSVWYFQTP